MHCSAIRGAASTPDSGPAGLHPGYTVREWRPLPGEEAARPAEPDRVDPAVPGWVYAEQQVKPA